MSINGSDKERTFTFYQKFQKEVMEKVLGYHLDKISLEKPFGGYKIDLHAVNPERKLDIYVENQLTPSDEVHFQKVINLIGGITEGIIVWVALCFKDTHLNAIKAVLRDKRHKYINFYAVEIAPELINYVQFLDQQFKLHVLSNLELLDQIQTPLILVDKTEQIPKTFIGNANIDRNNFDFTRSEEIREYVREKLQEQIPYFPNLHYGKKGTKYDLSLHIGAGLSGLTYICSVRNGRNQAFVELYFDKSKWNIFKFFLDQLPSMKTFIDPEIEIRNRKIGVYFKPSTDLDKTINRIGEILDNMIKYFSPYTYR